MMDKYIKKFQGYDYEWFHINQAPLDGTIVDLWLVGELDYYRQCDCYWSEDHQYWRLVDGGFPAIPNHRTATHWRRIPLPPQDYQ